MTDTAATATVERLKHGCPNCGAHWPAGKNKGVPIGGLLICYDCAYTPGRLKHKQVIAILRGLQWSQEKLDKLKIDLLNHIACLTS